MYSIYLKFYFEKYTVNSPTLLLYSDNVKRKISMLPYLLEISDGIRIVMMRIRIRFSFFDGDLGLTWSHKKSWALLRKCIKYIRTAKTHPKIRIALYRFYGLLNFGQFWPVIGEIKLYYKTVSVSPSWSVPSKIRIQGSAKWCHPE